MAKERSLAATLIFGHDPEQWDVIVDQGLRPGI